MLNKSVIKCEYKANWGQLFEINNIVSQCFVKILNVNITNTLLFFVQTAMQKILTFFQQKITEYLKI